MKHDDASYLSEARVVDGFRSAVGVGFDQRCSMVSVYCF